MIYDVAVIGAGPAGSMAAYIAAKNGLKTLLVEEHKAVGEPCHCTGKLSVHAFRDFDLPRRSVLHGVKSAIFYSPSNIELSIRGERIDSYVVDRVLLDQGLAEMACLSGAELALETKAYDVSRSVNGNLTLKAKRKGATVEFKSKLIIDAEGSTPTLLEKFGLKAKKDYLVGLQYDMSNVDFHSIDCVELYFGRHVAPGFFAWIVPVTENEARVGLCVRAKFADMQVQDYLKRFISSHPIASRKLKNGKIKRIYAGKEPIEGPIERTFADGALVVGDSAGHVKSTSGGGIYFALKAAEMAGKTAVECLESEVHDRGCLRIYEARWRKAIGSELSFTSFIRRFLDSLTDEDLDRIFKLIAEDEEMLNIIERHGDTAYQSKLLIPMVKRLVRKPLERISSTFLLSKIALKGLIALLM